MCSKLTMQSMLLPYLLEFMYSGPGRSTPTLSKGGVLDNLNSGKCPTIVWLALQFSANETIINKLFYIPPTLGDLVFSPKL